MVTVDQLKQWDGDRLGRVADELHDRRSALTDLADEVAAGRPPASWVGGASVYAEQAHDRLANRLTDQVAELNLVISALDAASGAVRSARTMLDDALARAASNSCTVSSDGTVRSTETFADEDEQQDAQRVVDEIAQAVGDALTKAADADIDLAAALWSAQGSDVDARGGLGDQTLPDALRGLSTEEQVDYLLDHPDLADVMLPSLPGSLKEELGQGLSDLVDSQVNDEDFDLDQEKVDRLSALIDAYGSDSDVAAALYEDLGADGTMATMSSIESYLRLGGMDEDAVRGLADDLRRTLGVASQDPQFDSDGFGEDLARFATWQIDDGEREAFEERYGHVGSSANASVLTYLMGNHHLDGDLVEAVATELDAFERNDDGVMSAQEWYGHTGHSPLNATDEFTGYADDPMAATLANLGSHPDNAYSFLTDDPARQDYYFHERDSRADGFSGVTQLVNGLGTDPDMLEQHRQGTGEIVSRFFHGLATNEHFSVDDARASSPHLGELMKHYTPAIDAALRNADPEAQPGTYDYDKEYVGRFDDYPRLLKDDLRELMQVAVSTDEGATRIAEGIGAYQQTQVNNLADLVANDPRDGERLNELRDVLERAGGLQGFAEHAVGSTEIAEAEDHDRRVEAFSDIVGEAAGLVPLPGSGIAGEVLSAAVDQGVELGTGAFNDAYGSQTEAAAASAEERAELGATRLKVNAYLSLVEAGVIPASEVDERWRDGAGGFISAADIPRGELGDYSLDASDGLNNYAPPTELETAYKNEYLNFYSQFDG